MINQLIDTSIIATTVLIIAFVLVTMAWKKDSEDLHKSK